MDIYRDICTQKNGFGLVWIGTPKSQFCLGYIDGVEPEKLQNFLDIIFKACFIHRYRDDIRSICIQELGEWMRKCPTKYLDTFLQYIHCKSIQPIWSTRCEMRVLRATKCSRTGSQCATSC
jgi:hypothetical protein